MTTPYLIEDLKRDEGLRLSAYPDPLSGGSPYTIGYGHTGPEVYLGLVWSKEKCEIALADDIQEAIHNLNKNLPWWKDLNDERQDVLINMCFNLGIRGLLKFINTLHAIRTKDWYGAAMGMKNSLWAKQVGERSQRLARQMLLGKRSEN